MWWGLGRKSYLGQAEITCFCLFRDLRVSSRFPCVTPGVEIFSLDLCRAVKNCGQCVLEVECMGEGVVLNRECTEFVTACSFLFFFLFFFFSFLKEWVLEDPVFLNNISNYFPDASNKTSSFTIYVAGWCPFFL